MKSHRPRLQRSLDDANASDKFAIQPIIINIIAIIVLAGIYYFIIQKDIFPEWIKYIYWTINILITYNIVAASARSFLMPILTIIAFAAVFLAKNYYDMTFLTDAEQWQLLIVGVIGLIISAVLKL